MEKVEIRYGFFNIIILILTTCIFIYEYKNINEIFYNKKNIYILIMILTVLMVHIIKAGRLYLALYGLNISFLTYMKMYCKTTPVSVLFPFKIGEIFRMYCYGKNLENILRGVVVVVLDRFMDTVALITMIFLMWIFNKRVINSYVYILLVFLILVLLVYFIFPSIYKFWKKYILRSKATERKLIILKFLDILNLIYQETMNVSKGRGTILYFMSLMAWGVEIGSIIILNNLFEKGEFSQKVSVYLTSAISENQSIELRQFIFISVFFMIVSYIGVKIVELLSIERRGGDENNYYIR